MNDELKIGDLVKYPNGNRGYTITSIKGDLIILDEAFESSKTKIQKLNHFSLKDSICIKLPEWKVERTGKIVGIKFDNNKILYCIEGKDFKRYLSEKQIYENRLQEQDNSERRGSISESGGKLRCRNKVSYKRGHRGNSYCSNKSRSRVKVYHADLSLGQ